MYREASGKSLKCWSKCVFCGASSFAEGGRCGCCSPKASYFISLGRAGRVMSFTGLGQSVQLADTDPASVSGESLANIQCDHLSVAFDFCRSPAKGQHRQQQALTWI